MIDELELGNGCCACAEGERDGFATCEDKKNVFTKREQAVLAKIREASMRARALKESIRGLSAGNERWESARSELDGLRRLREELEKERIAAAEERMRLLGHIS